MEMGTDAAANLRPRLMRDINCLRDPDRLTRKRALASLRTALLSQDNVTPPKEESLRKFLVDTLLDPLLTLFTDPIEFCREQSMLLLLDTVAHTADDTSDTSAVCKAVAASARSRIGCTPFEEPSEEVRLLLLRLLQFLWDRPSASIWGECAVEDTSDVVMYSLSDIFPEAKRQSCVLLQRLIAVCGDGIRFKFERTLRALSGNLSHQHSKTRQLALATVAPLIVCCVGSDLEKLVREVLLQNLEVLLNDKSPGVRRELVRTLERIMVAIETKEAQELAPLRSRLASILLSCLLDTLPDIAERAEKSIEVVANTWLSASKDNDAAASVADLEVVPAEDRSSSAVVSRAYIGALVSELVPLTIQGMSYWTVLGRRRFCGLLGEIISRTGGDSITPHLYSIVLALCTASTDDEEDVRSAVQQASQNLGIALEEPSVVTDILIPIISGHISGKASPQYSIEALLVLRPFLSCTGSRAGPIVGDTAKALCAFHILSAPEDDGLTTAVLGVCDVIFSPPYVELLSGDLSKEALTALIWLLGRSGSHSPAIHERAYGLMENLAMVNEKDGVQSLLSCFFLPLLRRIVSNADDNEVMEQQELPSHWADDPSVRHAFNVLLESAPMAVALHLNIIVPYFCAVLKDTQKDSHIRLDLMTQLQGVLGSYNMTPTIVKPQLKNIVNDAILPNLTWNIGVVAATLRKVAVACLYTILHGGKLDTETAYSLGPSLLPVLNTNLEDGDAATRRLCCLCMHMILNLLPGALGEDPIRLLYQELLKRLDDSSNGVRSAACEAINSLFMATPKIHLLGTPLEYSVEQLLIHLDDQDASIQEAVMKPLRTAMQIDACMVSRKASQARESHRSPNYVDKLIQ